MRIELSPTYKDLRPFVEKLSRTFDTEGTTIYNGRNQIKVFTTTDGKLLNVKRYRIPSFPNRIIYSWFRNPKGLRAFNYPQTLLDKGFETPQPIAYIEERRNGLITYSYFVCEQCPYKRNFYEFGDATIESCREVVDAFAHYTAALHEADILHLDYSPGNILFDKINGQYHFSLIDLNRMHFGPVSLEQGCANFARLWGQKDFFIYLAKNYAKARGADETFCIQHILHYRKKFWLRYRNRHEVKFNLEF